MVRGIVLNRGANDEAGPTTEGYAQLAYEGSADAVPVASRIAAALDDATTLPVVVCHESLDDDTASQVVAELQEAGFSPVTLAGRRQAEENAGPGGAGAMAAVEIPDGLLASHPGLKRSDLTAIVGAGLGQLVDTDRLAALANMAGGAASATAHAVGDTASGVADAAEELVTGKTTDAAGEIADAGKGLAAGIPAAAGALADDATVPIAPQADPVPVSSVNTSTTVADSQQRVEPAAEPTPVSQPQATDESGGSRWLLLAGAALALMALVGLLATQCGGDESASDQDTITADPTAIPASEPATSDAGATDTANAEPTAYAEPTAAAEPAAAAEPTAAPEAAPDEPEPTEEPEPTVEPTTISVEDLPPLSSLPERGAVYRPPILYLEGPVRTQEEADTLYESAVAIIGAENVQNNYVVRPDAPPVIDGNLRVESAVLFETNSAVIEDEFLRSLDLGVVAMALNPQVTAIVEGHTDSVGNDASNRVLSQQRAQAVVDYLVSRGVEPSRLQAVGRGESQPFADNATEEGRQLNRRIEVLLFDLLPTE